MKRLIIILAMALLLAGMVWPGEKENPPTAFRVIQYQFLAMGWVDYSITSYALATGNFKETNPIAKLYASQPALSITINLAGEGFLFWGTTQMWKSNKTLGWIMLIGFTAARAYVLYRNIKTLNEHYR